MKLLEEIRETGLFYALEKGMFADVKRSRTGGKGLEGVLKKAVTIITRLKRNSGCVSD